MCVCGGRQTRRRNLSRCVSDTALCPYVCGQGNLRRMVYLFLKEVAESTNPAELLIVVQSLCRDMNNSDDKSELYRANACRVLSRILDVRRRARPRQTERLLNVCMRVVAPGGHAGTDRAAVSAGAGGQQRRRGVVGAGVRHPFPRRGA